MAGKEPVENNWPLVRWPGEKWLFHGTVFGNTLDYIFRATHPQAFTLVELLLAMGIIGILSVIVLVAINPTRQLALSRNAARQADTLQILKAVQQYALDNDSALPMGVNETLRMIGTETEDCDVACPTDPIEEACLDLSAALVPDYLAGIPVDILNGSAGRTLYAIQRLADNRVLVRACNAEFSEEIVAEQ